MLGLLVCLFLLFLFFSELYISPGVLLIWGLDFFKEKSSVGRLRTKAHPANVNNMHKGRFPEKGHGQ